MTPRRVWEGTAPLRRSLVSIDSLEPWPGNPRRGDVEAIRGSLRRFGQLKPVIVRESRIVAGHHIVLAALEEGWTHVAAFDGGFETEEEARAFLIADNRTSELGTVDEEALAVQLAALTSLDGVGYTEQDRADLDARLAALRGEDPPAPPPPPDKPRSKMGEVYELGPHRILCGDSTDADQLAVLYDGAEVGCVLTDPPYGIKLDTDYSKIEGSKKSRHAATYRVVGRSYRAVAGDDQPFDAGLLSDLFAATREQFWFGANYYRRTLPGGDLDGSWFVWDKRPMAWEHGSVDNVIGSGFELIWSRKKHQQRLLRHQWFGYTARNRDLEREHPTEKPVGLLVELLKRAPEGCAVADPFLGSGTALVACHQTGRTCLGVELDPGYCDVVRRRYAELVGDTSILP